MMIASPLLAAERLSKCYRLYTRPVDRFKELLLGGRRYQEFWALQDVSLAVERGMSVGVLGENGAGKSTLLKLIAGVLTPTSGRLAINGRVASIIELGMGFHPELTGRENVFIGSSLMGVSRKETESKLSDIEAFAELGEFLDRPMKTYSTGMAMRLSFALAVNVEPDLLIVDEALAVGDGYFQKKCIDRIRAFQENGGSLLLCSHSLYQVNLLCQKALWLRSGQVEMYGPTVPVIAAYEAYLETKEKRAPEHHWREQQSGGELTEVRLEGGTADAANMMFSTGDDLAVRIWWRSDQPERLFHLGVVVERVDNIACFGTTTLKDGFPPFSGQLSYVATIRFPKLPLSNGAFRVIVVLLDEHGLHVYSQKTTEQTLTIRNTEKEWGICHLPHVWELGVDKNEDAA